MGVNHYSKLKRSKLHKFLLLSFYSLQEKKEEKNIYDRSITMKALVLVEVYSKEE